MIVVSALLVVVALVTFIIGVFRDADLTMIWVSIGASLLAALTLLLGVMRGRKAVPEAVADSQMISLDLPSLDLPSMAEESESATAAAPVSSAYEPAAETASIDLDEFEEDVEEPVTEAEEAEEISVPGGAIVASPRSSRPKTTRTPARKATPKRAPAKPVKKAAAKTGAGASRAKAAKPSPAKKAGPAKSAKAAPKAAAARRTTAKAAPAKAAGAKAAKAAKAKPAKPAAKKTAKKTAKKR